MEEGKTLHLPLLTPISSLRRNSTSVADPGGGTGGGEGVRTLPFPNSLFDAEILHIQNINEAVKSDTSLYVHVPNFHTYLIE